MIRNLSLCAVTALSFATRSFACGPDGCDYNYHCLSVGSVSFIYCSGDNRDFLDSGNDSRYNMALLFAHATGQPVSYGADYEVRHKAHKVAVEAWQKDLRNVGTDISTARMRGMRDWDSQCQSNSLQSATAFLKALGQTGADTDSLRDLAAMRNELLNVCGPGAGGPLLAKINAFEDAAKIAKVKDAATYLRGSLLFYTNEFDKSIETLLSLSKSEVNWIRDAAALVTGRAWLVRAQKDWAGYDDRAKINQNDLTKSEEALKQYLQSFPQGVYRASAEGLLRRVAWLRGDTTSYTRQLNAAIDHAISEKMSMHQYWHLIDEVEQTGTWQILGEFSGQPPGDLAQRMNGVHPHIAAISIMVFLRKPQEKYTSLLRSYLDKNGPHFQKTPGLQPLLIGMIDRAHGRWKEAGQAASEASAAGDVIGLTADIIRAETLELSGETGAAAELLTTLLEKHKDAPGERKVLSVAYIRTQIRLGTPENITKRDSPVDAETAARAFYLFTPEQLQKALAENPAEDRKKALAETFLLRLLLNRQWQEYMTAYENLPNALRPRFTPVETAVRTLIKSPDDAKALFNAGYFLKGVAGDVYALNPVCQSPKHLSVQLRGKLTEELQKTPGIYKDPLAYYEEALKKNPDRELKAKILAHAIQCFSPVSGARAECKFAKEPEVPVSQRRKWFETLKRELKGTTWEKKTEYYY